MFTMTLCKCPVVLVTGSFQIEVDKGYVDLAI